MTAAASALFEAADAGISLIVCITEGIPVQHVARAIHNVAYLPTAKAALVARGATPVLVALAAQPAVTASPAAAEWVGKARARLQ